MPYISTDKVKEFRNEIKKLGGKISVTRRHHSTVCVNILEHNFSLDKDRGHESINHYYIKDHWGETEWYDLLKRIHEIVGSDVETIIEDGDYGNVPNYYIDIEIGKWDRPYKQIEA